MVVRQLGWRLESARCRPAPAPVDWFWLNCRACSRLRKGRWAGGTSTLGVVAAMALEDVGPDALGAAIEVGRSERASLCWHGVRPGSCRNAPTLAHAHRGPPCRDAGWDAALLKATWATPYPCTATANTGHPPMAGFTQTGRPQPAGTYGQASLEVGAAGPPAHLPS